MTEPMYFALLTALLAVAALAGLAWVYLWFTEDEC